MAACVTRILELRNFAASVKTRDVYGAFPDFGESFKIKWIDDNSLYLVFADAITAKRMFLQYLGSMPPQLQSLPNKSVNLIPYKGADAQAIITHTQRPTRTERTNSISQKDVAASALATGNVSPAVSMLLLAAAAAGPPGSLNGTQAPSNNQGYSPISPQQQQASNNPFVHRQGSNGNLRSSFSQGSIPESYSYGLGGGVPSISTSSSWSDSSSNYSNYRMSGRNGSISSLHPSGFPMSRSGLEDIAEASSRDEFGGSRVVSRTNSITPGTQETVAQIVVTASTPLMSDAFEAQQANAPTQPAADSQTSSPGKTRSDTERPGDSWLSREPSPTPSLPSLRDPSSISPIVDGVARLGIHGRTASSPSEDMVPSDGERLSDGARNGFRTPPRIGNPGRRMLGHALGIRHPSLPPRVIAGAAATN
ncbi:hypothetical protein FRC14_000782 [Serendipita sp. 396]|nr:hypothetical protein FRC14_000782 [Serendipita sp. 396]KAG8784735.1 hypothetical protein FRC15_002702 [Serendipita sp. 397]KAG8800862.1 hypothetical protein FRC16_001889 [Serendipita sp. 398]KAG8827234.1 hypothetical protein FRC19_004753 [Serendipita sp. 401]KAG8834652.1 hypothetical protein FRC18_001696 [Serendipita sp. 400]KAG8853685.1 hypothetical protein FRB91_004554 [Serendipita sp. 411]KAG8869308.1 hypothetical protein FRC20_001697 [Serendipita sp. 405]KAG9056874.1 hypothetical prot